VLVTGVTGFIGREVVRHLLASGRRVVAMARSQSGEPAVTRVAKAVGHSPDGFCLNVVGADRTRPAGGLDEPARQHLRATVETVIHCAGDTIFFPDDMISFRAGHIDGSLTLLQALQGGQLRRWAHLSTAYVCGRRSGTVLEHDGDIGQGFHNPYEQVKLEAEEAVRGAGARLGVDVRVFRPSVVFGVAPETAGGHPSNRFFAFIRMLAALARFPNTADVQLRIAAAPQARFNIVPVEYVATAMVALAEHPDGFGETFHLVVSDPPTQETMLAMIAAYLGLRGLSLMDARHTQLENPSPLERNVARMGAIYLEYLTQDIHFDDRIARRLLDCSGVPRPTLLPDDVHRFLDQALMPSADPERERWPLTCA
jgi:thioester reductase-like protein